MGSDHHQHAALAGKTAPRTVIGSVSASEFLVASAASLGFLVGLGRESAGNLLVVAGLALGGVIAAPFAAWLVSRVPATLLGTAVGGVIVLTNAQKLFKSFDITGAVTVAGYLAILGAWAALLFYAWKRSTLTPAEAEGDFTGVELAVETELTEPAVKRER
ncbi:hypothetical protein GCM10020255_081260 [Rhodococcus baikonurensis]